MGGDFRVTDQPSADQKPRSPRKNLLLSATIEAGALKAPVRIRNMSETGAMLDGPALPDTGTSLMLRRLQVEIGALVVWNAAGRCGVAFDGKVSVDEWVAGVRQIPRLGSSGQARVDAIQSALRSGDQLAVEPTAPTLPVGADELDSRIAEEIDHARRLLEDVGDELTDDPVLLQRHADALQRFDIACQIISHLGAVIGAPDRMAAIEGVTMLELKSRLLRKAIF